MFINVFFVFFSTCTNPTAHKQWQPPLRGAWNYDQVSRSCSSCWDTRSYTQLTFKISAKIGSLNVQIFFKFRPKSHRWNRKLDIERVFLSMNLRSESHCSTSVHINHTSECTFLVEPLEMRAGRSVGFMGLLMDSYFRGKAPVGEESFSDRFHLMGEEATQLRISS